MRTRAALLAALPVTAFLLIYIPDAGHGFIKDDYGWILNSRVATGADVADLFRRSDGFYRPLVALTFALNYRLAGIDPRLYGATNLLLAIGCAAALYALARSMAMSRGEGLVAAGLWAFNFHGINMAVLWISGRTSLLVTLAALLAARALVLGRLVPVFVCALAALLSKEEAVALPAIFAAWLLIGLPDANGTRVTRRWMGLLMTVAAAGVYFLLRARTSAMLPSNAPDFYRFTFEPGRVLENLLEYADRALTLPAAAVLLFALYARPRSVPLRDATRVVALGLTWVLLGYSLTLFLPVRSSLYACLPSAGAALAAAAVIGAIARGASPVRVRRAAIAALLLPVLLWPVYHARNRRWVSVADFSTAVVEDLARALPDVPEGAVVILEDDRSAHANVGSAFGNFVPDAALLHLGRRLTVAIEPPLPGDAPVVITGRAVRLAVRNGRLVRR